MSCTKSDIENLSFGPKSFSGNLSIDDKNIFVRFSIAGNRAGKLSIVFDRFSHTSETRFLKEILHERGTKFRNYKLIGVACDGQVKFESNDVIFTSLANKWSRSEGDTIAPVAHYSSAHINMCGEFVQTPTVVWRLKGFESFVLLRATCEIGEIVMEGAGKLTDEDELCGKIVVQAKPDVDDIDSWREEAEALCDHIRDVMSFASGTYLLCPITEFLHRNNVQITAWSQGRVQMPENAAFKSLSLNEIFQCAVRSFFEPKIKAEKLKFAIKWFLMRNHYTEGLLITSMTVLENLIDSNLSDDDVLLMSDKQLKRLKKKLRGTMREELGEWLKDPVKLENLVVELDGRLADLKRKSLFQKLFLLAERWGVCLEDIPEDEIKLAKRARDHIVHRGHFPLDNEKCDSLHDCVLTVREVVVRFILTSLGFPGEYWSYRGGYHTRRLQVSND